MIIKRVSFFILAGSIFCMFAVSGLLFYEYLFFRRQSNRLLELQEDYRTYVCAVNKILHDYNKVKEKLDILSSKESLDKNNKEKKKELDLTGQGFYTFEFHKGSRVFSSDDLQNDSQESFLLVNRDLDYLKESWLKYSQQALLAGKRKVKKQKKKPRIKKQNRKVSSYRQPILSSKKGKREQFSLVCPMDRSTFWMSSYFGPRKKPNGSWGFHYGVDMAALRGTAVFAAETGIVVEARYSRGYGNTVLIVHGRKYRTRYAHLDKIMVGVGKKVKRRQLIGKVGSTGLVWKRRGIDPSHLHFEVYAFGKQVNPLSFFV